MYTPPPLPPATLWDHIPAGVAVDDCWEWKGAHDQHGYGRITRHGVQRTTINVPRLAWSLANGPIPTGAHVLHSCDNPPCFNPRHLHLGTQQDNMREARERGRSRPPEPRRGEAWHAIHTPLEGKAWYAAHPLKTHCTQGHEFTPENTAWRPGHLSARRCRACSRERSAEYAARKVASRG